MKSLYEKHSKKNDVINLINDINSVNSVNSVNDVNDINSVNKVNKVNKVNDETDENDENDETDETNENDDLENIGFNNTNKIKNTPQWTKFYEIILIDWCDKSMCYRYLHNNCNRYYNFMNIILTIPVIFISTITGVANFAQERIPDEYVFYYTIGVGSLNIMAGFITTISQFLKIAELNEAHKASAIAWGKLHRNIKLELAKKPDERDNVKSFIKNCKEYYELLIETSPLIKNSEIKSFNRKFRTGDFWKPEICDSLSSVKYTMYEDEPEKVETGTSTQINIPDTCHSPGRKIKNINMMVQFKERRDVIANNMELEEFVKSYIKENSRSPSIEEIYDNMEDKINKKYIDKFVERLQAQKTV